MCVQGMQCPGAQMHMLRCCSLLPVAPCAVCIPGSALDNLLNLVLYHVCCWRVGLFFLGGVVHYTAQVHSQRVIQVRKQTCISVQYFVQVYCFYSPRQY